MVRAQAGPATVSERSDNRIRVNQDATHSWDNIYIYIYIYESRLCGEEENEQDYDIVISEY